MSNRASESTGDAVVRVLRRARAEPDRVERCRCGCAGVATYVVEGIEQPSGKPFFEGACSAAASYLAESSGELGVPFVAVMVRRSYGPPSYHVRARGAEAQR